MGYYEHLTFTAIGFSDEWKADITALLLELEGHWLEEYVATAQGMNGYFTVTLMPFGGKTGRGRHEEFVQLKVKLRRMANKDKTAEWAEMVFGGDREFRRLVEVIYSGDPDDDSGDPDDDTDDGW